MTDHIVKIVLERSEAMAEQRGMPAEQRVIEPITVNDGPWVQFTYGSLRFNDGAEGGIEFVNGVWLDEEDAPWSDLIISIEPAPAPPTRRVIRARFVPQAWVRDQAVEVDAEGDTEWDASAAFDLLSDDYRAALLAEMERSPDGQALDRDDALQSDPNAPEWIRNWHGPFDLYVWSTGPASVWVSRVETKHGDDTNIHATMEGARANVHAHVVQSWPDHDYLPAEMPDDEDEAIQVYFELAEKSDEYGGYHEEFIQP